MISNFVADCDSDTDPDPEILAVRPAVRGMAKPRLEAVVDCRFFASFEPFETLRFSVLFLPMKKMLEMDFGERIRFVRSDLRLFFR